MNRAVIFARVSTAEQARSGTSIGSQISRCEAAAIANDWTVVATHVDEGISGAKASRPEWNHVLKLVEAGSVDLIVVTKLDRAARSVRNLEDLIDLCDQHNVGIASLDDDIDLTSPSGRALVRVRGVFAEFEHSLIRERMMEGLVARAGEQKWLGGVPPYGFRSVPAPDGHGKVLEHEPAEVAAIQRMAAVIIGGGSTRDAARQLNDDGILPRKAAR